MFSTNATVALLLAVGAGLGACTQEQPKTEEVTTATPATPAATITEEGGNSVVSSQDGEDVVIAGNNSVQTRTLSGQDIQIMGDGNQATFTGRGKDFYAVGNANIVVLENVKSIQVTGDNNVVTWRGTPPTIRNNGTNNTITQAK